MDTEAVLLGPGNGLPEYAGVLLVYALLSVVMLGDGLRLELNFRSTFATLYVGWVGCVFPGNYLFYKLGFMSFLPWVNNFAHCFLWIGLCLGFFYSKTYRLPLPQQFVVFAVLSFAVKYAENQLLGTWQLDHFFFVPGHFSYLVGWSLMDGLYPVISVFGLRLLTQWIPGLAGAAA